MEAFTFMTGNFEDMLLSIEGVFYNFDFCIFRHCKNANQKPQGNSPQVHSF